MIIILIRPYKTIYYHQEPNHQGLDHNNKQFKFYNLTDFKLNHHYKNTPKRNQKKN